jgi:SH3-like domain-containing protein
LRKSAFYIALLALFISLCAGLNARSLHQRDTLRNEAIIIQGIVNAKSSPDRSGTDLFTIHEGTKVKIVDEVGRWNNIELADGRQGWLPSEDVEVI